MLTKHTQISRRSWTWFTDFVDALEVEGTTLLTTRSSKITYAGVTYNLEKFSYTFTPNERYRIDFKLWLDPKEEGGLVLDLCPASGYHEWPTPPVEPMFSHSVSLVWGYIDASGKEVHAECIEHREGQ